MGSYSKQNLPKQHSSWNFWKPWIQKCLIVKVSFSYLKVPFPRCYSRPLKHCWGLGYHHLKRFLLFILRETSWKAKFTHYCFLSQWARLLMGTWRAQNSHQNSQWSYLPLKNLFVINLLVSSAYRGKRKHQTFWRWMILASEFMVSMYFKNSKVAQEKTTMC